jgi:hypothetical protein
LSNGGAAEHAASDATQTATNITCLSRFSDMGDHSCLMESTGEGLRAVFTHNPSPALIACRCYGPPAGPLPFGLFGEGEVPYCPELLGGFWLMPLGLVVGWLFWLQPAAASIATDKTAVTNSLRDIGMFLLGSIGSWRLELKCGEKGSGTAGNY